MSAFQQLREAVMTIRFMKAYVKQLNGLNGFHELYFCGLSTAQILYKLYKWKK